MRPTIRLLPSDTQQNAKKSGNAMGTPEEDLKVIDLLQTIEQVQRKGIPPGRELDRRFLDFIDATIVEQDAQRALLSQMSSELKANTEITKQVADVLASFRVIAAVSKWTTAIVAGVLAVVHGFDWIRGR